MSNQRDPAKSFVDLILMQGLGLIISHPSGVYYSNQTGGYACNHPFLEGSFAPLNDVWGKEDTACKELSAFFYEGPKWKGHCYGGIDGETVAFLEGLFRRHDILSRLNMLVDHDLTADSQEAWIFVTFEAPKDDDFPFKIPSGKGVLTWPNSD